MKNHIWTDFADLNGFVNWLSNNSFLVSIQY
jgi:hypothetical protein